MQAKTQVRRAAIEAVLRADRAVMVRRGTGGWALFDVWEHPRLPDSLRLVLGPMGGLCERTSRHATTTKAVREAARELIADIKLRAAVSEEA